MVWQIEPVYGCVFGVEAISFEDCDEPGEGFFVMLELGFFRLIFTIGE